MSDHTITPDPNQTYAPWVHQHGLHFPYGECQCGCGYAAPIAKSTSNKWGHIKGQPIRFVHSHNRKTPFRPIEERFWEKVDKRGPDECWEWQANRAHTGHGKIAINERNTPAHRVSYELHFGTIPDGMFVCHKCDNPPCVNPAHLFLGTEADNRQDMYKKLRHARGAKNGRSKLTDDQVAVIRARCAQGKVSFCAIANEYQVSYGTIYGIAKNTKWLHIK